MGFSFRLMILSVIPPICFLGYALLSKQYSILLEPFLAVFLIVAISIFQNRFSFFRKKTYSMIVLFFLLSLFVGKGLHFYSLFPYWDKILHFFSGFLLTAIGREVYPKLKGDTKNIRLFRLFAFLFAVAFAGMWEIYEFTVDHLFGLFSQNGSLSDTMWDIMMGTLSALLALFIK